MNTIPPKIHGAIDYLVVLFLLASPTIFGFEGLICIFTYALGAIHLLLTLLTDFNAGIIKAIPLWLHGYIELVVGVALLVLAFTLFLDIKTGRVYYTCLGLAVLLTWLLTDYKNKTIV
jgi:uncharacterized YccA/Bax inhibitor family protein